jgi:4-amino-4-deoxy-L-arabinose transferase-like glycosyltransferase
MASAVSGALTVGILYLVLREIGITHEASVLATLAFLVSHTFWSYAVRAEVYTLTLFLMALQAWLGLKWYHTGQRIYLAGTGFVIGLGLAAHLMVILYVPGLLWLMWQRRRKIKGKSVIMFLLAGAIGALPLAILIARDAYTREMAGLEIVRWALFSFEGYDFSGAFFDFSWRLLPSDTFQWLAFLGMQFLGLSGICGLLGILKGWQETDKVLNVYVVLLYLGAMVFAFAYRVGDRYVFYLPSYLPFAIWIGLGWQWALKRLRHGRVIESARQWWFRLILAALIVGIPIAAYRLAPELVDRGVTFRETRRVPGPKGKYYFLWPPKSGYTDARTYAEKTLNAAPSNAVILADPILSAPLRFLQEVKGHRTDVSVRFCCWNIEETLSKVQGRPIMLGDLSPEVYPLDFIKQHYDIQPRGWAYLLLEKNS